ncbi:glycoside hydrolase family 95-like protein [Chitinophaga sp. Cy-1792]|uniref:glycosyl hydrolase family 95 catalytic domain-containing protein n=1 Tax=Chitinophaga sp. Cy-1792 TaxID=2608339 RepID=UPI00141FE9B4|nr:glycoside hydrolase N-terminal domain-containing protein [Chitinophaga sp. Cy-1792]NIG53493.1 hypothetical protein [Chitinophaga sp. Cy-1792]
MKKAAIVFIFLCLPGAFSTANAQVKPAYNLESAHLAQRWDEAMPLGNGMLGALIWEKQGRLRLSLDRADLWDERQALDLSKFNFKDVQRWVAQKKYDSAHRLGDDPYHAPYPTKLPVAAMEFQIERLGTVVSNVLDIQTALNTVKFSSGATFASYIAATQNVGYFSFSHLPVLKDDEIVKVLSPELIVHKFADTLKTSTNGGISPGSVQLLGYKNGVVTRNGNTISYKQPTYAHHYFEIKIQWKKLPDNSIIGSWVIENDKAAVLPVLNNNLQSTADWQAHIQWWTGFWAKSSVSLPDSIIARQYYLDMYKLGAVARSNTPAITLQAVWTADNGNLPPWKGDFHNDLNTQLSYWPTYTGNHLDLAVGYINWLWNMRAANKQYTKQYFGVEGLNVPGTATLHGSPMGGWIQYSLSPTVVAWCAQHFYWQWKYSMDDNFLKTKAYTYIHEAATYLEHISQVKNGVRVLPLSSSPEFNDNNINAWFPQWTNFDLGLAKFLFTAAAEVAAAGNNKNEASHWQKILSELPAYDVNKTGLTVAPGQDLTESHRHMSPYMAVYPLALLDDNKQEDAAIIHQSLQQIEKNGTREWCGYSFSWMACLYARAHEADKAVKQLDIFATNFCSVNSFHLNGDQKGGEYSNFTYRPFTLEGNFAFMQGVHELLLQSRMGYIEVFPAVPDSWKDVSFQDLRAEGAFVISAKKENGKMQSVKITAEKDGLLKIKLPFKKWAAGAMASSSFKTGSDGITVMMLKKGQQLLIENTDK